MLATAGRVRVFWQPGCTSCLRTKEFLTNNGVDYESINVHGNPQGMEELRKLGARSVPVSVCANTNLSPRATIGTLRAPSFLSSSIPCGLP